MCTDGHTNAEAHTHTFNYPGSVPLRVGRTPRQSDPNKCSQAGSVNERRRGQTEKTERTQATVSNFMFSHCDEGGGGTRFANQPFDCETFS